MAGRPRQWRKGGRGDGIRVEAKRATIAEEPQ
jgi:hypothetical protein